MLDRANQAGGIEFRGAIQTAAYRYLAFAVGTPVGYIDCGTFDRCAVYGGEGQDGPIISETIDVATGSIAFAVDPALRRRGVGRRMIAALLARPELALVTLFEAGVESANTASRRCLEAVRFRVRSEEPDCERMLYYRRWRGDPGMDAQ
jgi:ribosomal protein S18 acetylase RimI-like enzyme